MTSTTIEALTGGVTTPLLDHAKRRSDHIALHFESSTIDYKALTVETHRISVWLQKRLAKTGAKRSPTVALCLPNSPMFVLCFIGAVRAGFEVQVYDSDWPLAMINALNAQLAPDLLISTHDLDTPYVDFDQVADALCADDANRLTEPLATLSPEIPFYTGFTSGSSSLPKGFRRNHASWLTSFIYDQRECALRSDDIILAPGALSHSLFLYALIRGLHQGVSVVFCRRYSVGNTARLIERHKATVLYAVPSYVGTLMRRKNGTYPRLRRVFSSGAKWPRNWHQTFNTHFPNAELCEFYGASETSFISIAKSTEPVPEGSSGRAFAGVTLSIRDQDGCKLPHGQTGQVFIASDMLFLGYTDNQHTESGQPNDAISVGDMGYLDDDGYLFLRGRGDRMLVYAGKNIYPEEIEQVLQSHPLIANAAVLPVPDEMRGQRLLALLCCRDEIPQKKTLIHYCQRRLSHYKVPTLYLHCSTWPTTRSGKTDSQKMTEAWRKQFAQILH